MKVQEVFTPGDFPEHTYVERERGKLENRLEHQLRRPGALISLSGPSKSGKTVLVERVVGRDDLVSVYGGDIHSADDLWNQVLDALGAPISTESASAESQESQVTANVGIRAHLFSAGGSASETDTSSEETVEIYERRGLDDIIEVNEADDFVLLIDDFHYMSTEEQSEIGEALKQASEAGLKICVALIPHRSDDLTQANPDLQGRALTVELEYWDKDDLREIGRKGFEALNVDFPEEAIDIFARESAGSPQLMQQLCYDACGLKGITETQEDETEIRLDEGQIKDIMEWTGATIDMDKVVTILNGEGISGKKQRKMHEFVDGTEGDVYEAILRGIACDPLKVSLDRSELVDGIRRQCNNGAPRIPSITQALERMDERISEIRPQSATLEWEDDTNTLQIPDPYLIFYLRWSDHINYYPEPSL